MMELLKLTHQAVCGQIDWTGMEDALCGFVLPMSGTEQNPVFHGEGDVWTHTKMVCEELMQLPDFQAMEDKDRQAVFLAALLHDIGKVPTTRWEDGRWTSPHHSLVGSKMAREFLWQTAGLCGTPEAQLLREKVCLLIRYHSLPPHAIDDPDGKRKLRAIAANGQLCSGFTLEQLCLLSQADAMGRSCTDKPQMLEQIDLCRELAEESGCYDRPFPFPSDHTRYCYLSGKEIAPQIELYDDSWGDVILLSGLPGTGKDTWIKTHCPDLPVISLDEIRKEMKIAPTDNQTQVAEAAKERAKELLRSKRPFVWNATNLSPLVRGKQLRLFGQYGAACRIVYLETEWAEQLRRNADRENTVPERAICHMMGELVLPEIKEAHRVQWYCI